MNGSRDMRDVMTITRAVQSGLAGMEQRLHRIDCRDLHEQLSMLADAVAELAELVSERLALDVPEGGGR